MEHTRIEKLSASGEESRNAGLLSLQEECVDFNSDKWFDCPLYSEAQQQMVLEIVARWDGQLVDILHLHQPRRLTLGNSPRADLSFPLESLVPLSASDDFTTPLVDVAGKGFLLCLDPEIQGTIQQNGETFTPLQLIHAGKAHPINESLWFNYPLVPGVNASFQIEALELELQFVPAPLLPLPRFWAGSLLLSLCSLSVLVFLLGTFCFALPEISTRHQAVSVAETRTKRKPPQMSSALAKEFRADLVHVCGKTTLKNTDKPNKQRTCPTDSLPHNGTAASPVHKRFR